MEVKAQLRFTRMSPKKIRLVANLIKGMPVQEALNQLSVVVKGAQRPVEKLLLSAIANAEHNFGLERSNLYIREITSDLAGMLKRFTPKAHGRATVVRKRMTHLVLTLDELVPSKTVKKKTEKSVPAVQVDAKPAGKDAEKVKLVKKESVPAGHEKESGVEIHDVRMEGKHRHGQNADRSGKGKKGFVQKMFNRKSS